MMTAGDSAKTHDTRGPEAFTQLIAAESARWQPLIRSLGITLD